MITLFLIMSNKNVASFEYDKELVQRLGDELMDLWSECKERAERIEQIMEQLEML